MMTSSLSKVVSLFTGLTFGSVCGIYLSQNYSVPNVSSLIDMLLYKAQEYSKSDDEKND